jgi:adenylate kinase family enzyme
LNQPEHLGGASIAQYPPSAYVTQLTVRVLRKRRRLDEETAEAAKRWAWTELRRQLALRISESKFSDMYSLAYSALITIALSSPAEAQPEEKRSQQTALKVFFDSQQQNDGSWPLSRPLFHYPGVGNAYCFEYELLAELLAEDRLRKDLLEFIPNLIKATDALKSNSFPLASGALGWASGHHPQLSGPESWSTASVFHFAYSLDRLVAEGIRRELFVTLDQPYSPAREPKPIFAEEFVDSNIEIDGQPLSLKAALLERFVEPIKSNSHLISGGRPLSPDTAISAIFFGPPGTSKTTLASLIAEYLGWPLLVVDPSHLVRNGMDRVQAEANTLFSMLAASERLVVLFDEFDEMVRERSLPNTDATSRFLTTAMLPKLSSINKRKRIVFILATNYVDQFDFAIARPGRFDRRFQVMPPTMKSKLAKFPNTEKKLRKLDLLRTEQPSYKTLCEQLEAFTLDEFKALAKRLESATDQQQALSMVSQEFKRCTLEQYPRDTDVADSETWQKRCIQQKRYIR